MSSSNPSQINHSPHPAQSSSSTSGSSETQKSKSTKVLFRNLQIDISAFSHSSDSAGSQYSGFVSNKSQGSPNHSLGSSSELEEDGSNSDSENNKSGSVASSGSEVHSSEEEHRSLVARSKRQLGQDLNKERDPKTRRHLRKKRGSGRSKSPPLHYRNYYQYHHLRVDKFSFIRVLHTWILNMTCFLSKYHKEICLCLFLIASGLAGLRTG